MATPTLKRSWGFTGLSGLSSDTANNFKITLEPAGTPRAVVSGDFVVVTVACKSTDTATITDDQSNTWTSAVTATNSTLGTPKKYTIFWARAGAGTGGMRTITIAFAGLTTDVQFSVHVFYNCDTSATPIDTSIAMTGITPANNTAPNVQPGNLTTTVDGDLIFNIVWDEADGTPGDNNTINGITFQAGTTGLYAEAGYGQAAFYQIQTTHGAINPGMTFSQTTHDSFASLAIAIKPGTGGAAPTAGISILRSQWGWINNKPSTTIAFPFPCSGSMLVVMDLDGSATGVGTTSVTDSSSNTYSLISGTDTTQYPQLYHVDSPTTGNNLVTTLHTSTGTGVDIIIFYDITGSATSPLDTGATAANSSTLTAANSGGTFHQATQGSGGANLTDAPSIVPSKANGLVIGGLNIGTGPESGSVAFTYDLPSATWDSGGGDGNELVNGDAASHVFPSSATTQQFQYTCTNTAASTYNALAASFLAAPVSTSHLLSCLGAGQ